MIEVEEYDHLNHSPGFRLALRGRSEIEDAGFGPGQASLHYSQKTIVGFVDGRAVGVIVWEKLEHDRDAALRREAGALGRQRRVAKCLIYSEEIAPAA